MLTLVKQDRLAPHKLNFYSSNAKRKKNATAVNLKDWQKESQSEEILTEIGCFENCKLLNRNAINFLSLTSLFHVT